MKLHIMFSTHLRAGGKVALAASHMMYLKTNALPRLLLPSPSLCLDPRSVVEITLDASLNADDTAYAWDRY